MLRSTATAGSRSRSGVAGFLCGLVVCLAQGCASSSSDTPWPVAPDFERLRAEAQGRALPTSAGAEWTGREPEGDEPEVTEEPEPESTWGGRRRSVVAEELPPLKAGTPEAPSKGAKPPAPAEVEDLGDTDEIDRDPFFKDDEDEDE